MWFLALRDNDIFVQETLGAIYSLNLKKREKSVTEICVNIRGWQPESAVILA